MERKNLRRIIFMSLHPVTLNPVDTVNLRSLINLIDKRMGLEDFIYGTLVLCIIFKYLCSIIKVSLHANYLNQRPEFQGL